MKDVIEEGRGHCREYILENLNSIFTLKAFTTKKCQKFLSKCPRSTSSPLRTFRSLGWLKLISDEAEYIAPHYTRTPKVVLHRHRLSVPSRSLSTAHNILFTVPPYILCTRGPFMLKWGSSSRLFILLVHSAQSKLIFIMKWKSILTCKCVSGYRYILCNPLRLSARLRSASLPSVGEHFGSVNGNKFRFITLLCSKFFMLMDEIINF